ncbi:MAG: amidohydrolase [Cyclobacteriaceae bacterium]|nr:amidohydrolase [Cyclobacteriaceae bacterium]
MNQKLKITLIQSNLYWEEVASNLSMFEEKIWAIGQETDVIVLPEMFSTGFTMNAAKLAEPMNMTTFKWMRQMAAQTQALMLGSFIVKENNSYYNRLLWMEPSGNFKTYDKRHLFRMADEHQTYSAGDTRLTAEWRGWRICPLVCYDLRFPVWSRNGYDKAAGRLDYDVLVYVANWPSARVEAWDALLKARAIENLCYTVGVNRTGDDGNGIPYNGHSASYSPKGETLFFETEKEVIKTIELDFDMLQSYREKFPAWRDADEFEVTEL